jgi:hypothetical protein
LLYTDLLRLTVLLSGGVATALGGVTVVSAHQHDDTVTLIVAGAWWAVAVAIGLAIGRRKRAADGVSRVLAGARTATSLPAESPGRIALGRLWPIAVFALVCGGVAWTLPQVAAIGTGYSLLAALAWRFREATVTAVEDRDGVRFYVEPAGALRPVRLVRTPGLGRDRASPGHPPPPPAVPD